MTQKFARMAQNKKSRGWVATINNWTEEIYEATALLGAEATYAIIGKEVGEQGTEHLQCYFYFSNARSFSSMKKRAPTAHLEKANGTAESNFEYCSKEGNFQEFGEKPQQGKRTDIADVVKQLQEGQTTADEVCLANPAFYHQYGRTLSKAEDIVLRKRYRTEMTEGIWYYGATGTGKSHEAFKDFNPETTYVKPLEDQWWDGYTGQDTVILNDFRGQVTYSELLTLVDKWPHYVKRRNREPVPFMAKRVIVTSSVHPELCYAGVVNRQDNIDQLLRRFTLVEMTQKCSEGNTTTSEPILEEPI